MTDRRDTWQTLLEFDRRATQRLRIAEQAGLLRNLAAVFAHSGDSWLWFLGLGGLWMWGTQFWKARAAVMLVSMLVTAAVVLVIKFVVRRKRPIGEWGGIYRKTDPHSFPSGHAVRAMLLAVLALGTGPSWFGLLLLLWAPLVVLARVAMGVHYLSDVLVGAILGVVIGLVVLWCLPDLYLFTQITLIAWLA